MLVWISIFTILIYSAILTVVQIYKDNSSFFETSVLDIVVSGPICWVVALICRFVSFCYNHWGKHHKAKKKTQRNYNQSQVNKTVAKVVRIAKRYYKKMKTPLNDVLIKFRGCNDPYDDIHDPSVLAPKTAIHERLIGKYHHIYYCQRDQLKEALMPWLRRTTIEDYIENKYAEYWIEKYKDTEIYCLKETK